MNLLKNYKLVGKQYNVNKANSISEEKSSA